MRVSLRKCLLIISFAFVPLLADGVEANNTDSPKPATQKESIQKELYDFLDENDVEIADGETTIDQIVEDLKQIDSQITIFKENTKDTDESQKELNLLLENKNNILKEIPNAIINHKIDKKEISTYLNEQKKINNRVKRYQKNKNSLQYIDAYLDFMLFDNKEIFYKFILSFEKLYLEGATQTQLKKELQNTILALQAKDYIKYSSQIDGITDEVKKEQLLAKFELLKENLETYKEIIKFLSDNINLISSGLILKTFNLNNIIKAINSHLPFDANKINSGKILLITVTIVLFYSLRLFFANILYGFIGLFLRQKKDAKESKSQIIEEIKGPIGYLLIAYATGVCASIYYYPLPVPFTFSRYFGAVYIFLYAWLVIGLIRSYGMIFIGNIATRGARKDVLNMMIKIIYFFIIIIAVLLLLNHVGFNVSTILASLGIGGLAVALATKDIIANFFASIMLLFDNSFSQGDWIVCGDVEGTVVEIGLRKTTVRTFDNALVFVPNSTIMSKSVKNWSRRKVGRRIKTYIGLTYDTTPAQLRSCIKDIKEMLHNHPGIAQADDTSSKFQDYISRHRQKIVSVDDLAGYKNTLFVVLDEFAESSINIMIYCFTKSVVWAEFLETKEDVYLKIIDILEKNQVEFAFPSRTVYLEQSDS